MSDFDWSAKNESIVVNQQLAIAVFENPCGDVVIRQEGMPYDDEDDWVIVAKTNIPALIRALMAASGIETPAVVTLLPSPNSGAERQRRYRKRHAERNDDDGETVTRNVSRDNAERVTPDGRRNASELQGDGELPLGIAAE